MPAQTVVSGLTSSVASSIAKDAAKLQQYGALISTLVVTPANNAGDDAFHNINSATLAMKLFPNGPPQAITDVGMLAEMISDLKAVGTQAEVEAQQNAVTITQLKKIAFMAQTKAGELQGEIDGLKAQLALAKSAGGSSNDGGSTPTPPVVVPPTTTPATPPANDSSGLGWALAAAAAAGLVAYLATRQADATHHLQGK